ncbi:MAG TPA: putative DNA binding domain-containing protein [Pirellulaceae bacterium]|nr:putative DNA binding domain-containing protein [Pirellulaceae bacterium]
MDSDQLLKIVARGEDSRHQFKVEITSATALAQELVALSNSGGGSVLVGVADDGSIPGLTASQVRSLNQLISNASTNCVRPAINLTTENVAGPSATVVVISVPDGLAKPYQDNSGAFWVKSGSDKRRVTAREELQRLFQSALLIHADDVPVPGASIADLDLWAFRDYYKARFGETLDEEPEVLQRIASNMRLLSGESLTVAGVLLFSKSPQSFLPVFHVKAVWYPGPDIHEANYIDSANYEGPLKRQFDESLGFLLRSIHWRQFGRGVNSVGQPEVPRLVLEELLANAFVHRDYFVSAPIRLFVFSDRIELISPGHLPNNLTVANIRAGNSNIRNPVLASHANHLLPYRGLGTGILRALREYPDIELEDDRDGNQFRVVIRRKPYVESTQGPA